MNLLLKLINTLVLVCLAAILTAQGIPNPQPIASFLNGNLPSTTPAPLGSGAVAPNLLSQTGAFANLVALEASSGVIPYDMIEPFWSDGADKKRWLAVPNDGTHNSVNEQITFSNTQPWIFPTGTVLIKHFEVEGIPLETRFEVMGSDNILYYLTYRWNKQQTDATLLLGSASRMIQTSDGPQTWYFPGRTECEDCHNSQNGGVLGLQTRHINKNLLYPSTGIVSNQLVTLSHLGIITENITPANSGNYMALSAKDDASADLETRARSYIDVNCSNCHQPGIQNSAMFDARFITPLIDQNILYGPLVYDEGLINPKVVIPMDVGKSMMHYRMNSLATGIAMPPLAKNIIDSEGVQLIEDWINSLTPINQDEPVALILASPVYGYAPMNVNFDGSNSTEPNNLPLSYSWDFGDGNTGAGQMISHNYTTEGAYEATLTVDNGTQTSMETVTIVVNNGNPGTNIVGFTDKTSLISGNNFSGVAVGVADMNGDGKDDIVRYNNARSLNIHYQNAPDAAFTAHNYGNVSGSFQWGMCIADFDHNGYNDVLSGGAYDNLRVIKNNNGSDSYSNWNITNSNIFLQGVNFADIDNDGWSDVFACHDDGEARGFHNDQQGNLVYQSSLIDTETVPNSDNSGNYASIWTDYDNDGDVDLYISKCRIGVNSSSDPRRINMLWQNDGSGNYTEVSAQAGLKVTAQTWLSDFGDIDNDGDMDVIVINHYDNPNLMINNGDGTFTDQISGSGLLPTLLPSNYFGIQALFRDFNNDGFLDLIATGDEHFIFYNNGDGTFTNALNPFNSNDMFSLAVGDLNHDGFLDIYSSYGNAFNSPSNTSDRLWMNNGNQNNHFAVTLTGTQSNINGIGARVELHGDWGMQIREVRSGEGYGIMNSLSPHFGIGASIDIDRVVVKWPSGVIDEIINPAINYCLMITEGENCINCGDDCIDLVFTSNDLTIDESAITAIVSDGVVTSGTIVNYSAGEYILLEEGFEVELNATFSAFIEACGSN